LTSSDGPSTLPVTLTPRLAGPDDIPQLLVWGRKFYEMSSWSDFPFDEEKVEVVLLEMMEDPDSVIIMHDKGMIGGYMMTPFFSNNWAAQEMFWYAEDGGEELLRAFEAWGYVEGASRISMAGLGGKREKAIRRLYESQGYTPAETFFTRKVTDNGCI